MTILLAEMKGFMRSALAAAQGGKCYLCNKPINPAFYAGPDACTIDHVHAQSRNWNSKAWRLGNHLVAHQACNLEKANRRPTSCEILALFAANRTLGFNPKATSHWDEATGDCSASLARKSDSG